jgi:hypothetical protein
VFVHVVRHVYVCYAPCLEASCNTNHTIRCGLHSQCSGCCAIAMIASPHQLLSMCHTFPLLAWVYHRRRPYRVECTGSLLTSEVKQRRARSVLGWGTAWEDLRVLSAFCTCSNRTNQDGGAGGKCESVGDYEMHRCDVHMTPFSRCGAIVSCTLR